MAKAINRTEKRGPFSIRARKRDGAFTGVWIVDIPPHVSASGKRERKAYKSKTSAVDAADSMYRELQINGVLRGENLRLRSGMLFATIAERWLLDQDGRVARTMKRASSVETNAYQLKALGKAFAQMDVAQIGSAEIEKYQKTRLLDDGRKPPTINSEVATLIQVLSWAKKLKLIKEVPEWESIPVRPRRPDIPSPSELDSIIGHLEPRTQLLALFLAETGCRRGEAFSLEWSDIDMPSANVAIQPKAEFTPKSACSERLIPISLSLRDQLKRAREDDVRRANAEAIEPSVFVFPGRFGGKRTDMRKALASAVKKSGVQRRGSPIHLTPHIFRKAMATWLHANNVSDRMLQARLGHAPGSRVTNRVYVQVSTEEQRAIAFELPVLAHNERQGKT